MPVLTGWSAPLPPPHLLGEYNQVQPGLGAAIVQLMFEEAAHRRAGEAKVLDAEIEEAREFRHERARGQHYGLTIAIVCVVGSVITSALGHPLTAGFIGTGGVASIAAVFIRGRAHDGDRGHDDIAAKGKSD